MFGGLEAHLKRYVSTDNVLTLLKWPVIFLGASPAEAPAMYSLMTYAGHAEGTWYACAHTVLFYAVLCSACRVLLFSTSSVFNHRYPTTPNRAKGVDGGMAAPAQALAALAREKGILFKLDAAVTGFEFEEARVSKICTLHSHRAPRSITQERTPP
jgi:phytoene dehydrogenase-like protein